MNEHLPILEAAISDVGHWSWWTANLPDAVQLEFIGTQLWNPPNEAGKPPSGQIALRFRRPRLLYFLTLSDTVSQDWPELLQQDQMKPPGIDHESFTMTSIEVCARLVAKAISIRALLGEPGRSPLPMVGESLLAFEAGPVGIVIAAESLAVFNHQGELDEQTVLTSGKKWWEYWREYWRRKDTADPLPKDYACEVTIPAG